MSNAYERLTTEEFVSTPENRSLEMTGRMILIAASSQFRQYGTGENRLLKAYTDTEEISAEYDRRSNIAENTASNLIVKLGSGFMTIALRRGYVDYDGNQAVRTDVADLRHEMGLAYTYFPDEYVRQHLVGNALERFTNDLHATIDRNEIVLDRSIL